jgi:hypothetical protein
MDYLLDRNALDDERFEARPDPGRNDMHVPFQLDGCGLVHPPSRARSEASLLRSMQSCESVTVGQQVHSPRS